MKLIMDKLKHAAQKRKKIILFLLGIALIGLITGSIFITILSEADQSMVKDYITEFINKIDNNQLNYLDSFKNAFVSHIVFIFTIWILGMSVVGIPLNLFIYFAKTFIIGFSISAFILTYKAKGCLLALVYIFPHHIINIFVYTLLFMFSMYFSLRIINSFKSKKPVPFKTAFKRYVVIAGFCTIVLFLSTAIEVFVTPFLLDKLLFIIK